MNDLEQLQERLAKQLPNASLVIDRPDIDTATWWLDAELQGHLVVVQWRVDRGFGVSTPTDDDYTFKPDELHATIDSACERVVELLLGRLHTGVSA